MDSIDQAAADLRGDVMSRTAGAAISVASSYVLIGAKSSILETVFEAGSGHSAPFAH